MLNTKNNSNAKNSQSEVTKKVAADFREFFEKDSQTKEIYESLKVDNARKIESSSGASFLIEMTESKEGALKNYFSELVNKFENAYGHTVVIVPKRKIINGNVYRRYVSKNAPRQNTLTQVYDDILDDLVYPAVIVGKRIRFPANKSKQYKVLIDSFDKEQVVYRSNCISSAYKVLTNRDLSIEFQDN